MDWQLYTLLSDMTMRHHERQADALTVTENAFESALSVLHDFDPEAGFSLYELLVAIFIASGAKLPDSVIIGDSPRLIRQPA